MKRNLIVGTARVAAFFSCKSKQGSPVLVLAEDMWVAHDDEQSLSAGDCHVEPGKRVKNGPTKGIKC